MVGETVSAYSFSQKNQAKTLASAVYVKTPSGGQIELDPQHLYQRRLLMGFGSLLRNCSAMNCALYRPLFLTTICE